MREDDELQVSGWLRDGISAAQAGRRDEARELLMRVIEVNEKSEQAWLWLSGVVDTDEDRLICLENVLTLNPSDVRARAGLRWLQERGVGVEPKGVEGSEDTFMRPEGCAYCGLPTEDRSPRCAHCGGRLTTKQFKRKERSFIGYQLHAFWIQLASINAVDFFLIGFVWDHLDSLPPFIKKYMPYIVGRVVAGTASVEALNGTEVWVQIARVTLLGLAVLGGLDALGLLLRRPLAHTLGVVLIGLHLIVGLALFVLGFSGFLMTGLRGLFTVMLTVFMFNTVEDFSREEFRERLQLDRHLVNDVDYFTRGRAYEKRGMWCKALLHWRRAAALNPRRDTYFAAMARAYTHLGRYDQALAQMDEALRISRTPGEWQPLREIIVEAQRRGAGLPETVNRNLA